MITVNIGGETLRLLPYAPNNDAAVRLGVLSPVEAARRLTGRSTRRPYAMLLRHSLEWSVDLRAADFTALRNATQTHQAEDVVVPLWPLAMRGGEELFVEGGHTVAWNDGWGDFAIDTDSPEEWDFIAPLVRGFLAQPPSLRAHNDDLVTADFSLTEDAPASYALTPIGDILPADETFATALGYAAPVFPFLPDWAEAPTPGVGITTVDRQEIGPGRRRAVEFYPQTPELVQEAHFRFAQAAGAVELLEWWRRRAGTADAHWTACTQTVGRLAATALSGTRVLTFVEPVQVGSNGYLALFGPHGTIELGRIDEVDGNGITLAANLQHDWSPSLTCVTHAILARHTNKELAIDFERGGKGWIASATLAWREVAAEYAPAEGEVRGETLGRLKPKAWFFRIDLDYNGAQQTWRFTNWESGANADGHTWDHNACEFDKLIESIDLEDDTCVTTFRWVAGGPWENWLPGNHAAKGRLSIFRAEVNDDGTFADFRQVFSGEMAAPEVTGAIVKQRARGANALFAKTAPRQVMSKTCGTNLFRPRCGLALADWRFTAEIAAVAGTTVTVDTLARENAAALPTGFGALGWFALGWLEQTVAGRPHRFGIVSSTALAGGEIGLKLDRAFTGEAGDGVVVVPGCDRQGATCRGKFENGDNFRGFELMPAVAPNLIIPQRDTAPAKK